VAFDLGFHQRILFHHEWKNGTNMEKTINLSKSEREKLYSVAAFLNTAIERELGLQIPFDVYFQDPFVAEENPDLAFDQGFHVQWEPGLADGPTSARFAVVDYNGDSGRLVAPAEWDESQMVFVYDGQVLDREQKETLQFHQVHVWAVLQRALSFFESGFGCGRRIPWGFDGNRLIVVPHAGYGENAFYDRNSKSLQFYFFDRGEKRVYTCLSTDIINHEFGHAVLDGMRPYYSQSTLVETAAFHEFIGDITAILITLRNNEFRGKLAEQTGGDLSKAEALSSIAEQFGQEVRHRPYLRTANNRQKMSDVQDLQSAHRVSEVLTGTMFEILTTIAADYLSRGQSPKQAFWRAIARMQRIVIQPLDLLPPVDVTFRDYALAVLRAERLSNPVDPYDHHGEMLDVFVRREILTAEERVALLEPAFLYDRMQLSIFHDIDSISRSRAAAYRFLHDNRKDLAIPFNCDLKVTDLYAANKYTRQARRLPRQIVLEYVWEEEVPLAGDKFGAFNAQNTTLLCGGTLVFDENGNVLSWFQKPGAHTSRGKQRRDLLLETIAQQLASGRVGIMPESPIGLLGKKVPPLIAEASHGVVRFGLTPHLHLSDADQDEGGQQWEISF
jgi:hypothetical protein